MSQPHNDDVPAEEPVATAGAITAAAAAVLGLVVAFGVHLSDAQEKAVLGAVAFLAPLVAAWWARRRAYSPATVKRLVADAGGDR